MPLTLIYENILSRSACSLLYSIMLITLIIRQLVIKLGQISCCGNHFLFANVGKKEVKGPNLVWLACNQDLQIERVSHGKVRLVYALLCIPGVILLSVSHNVSWTGVITWVKMQGNVSIWSGTTLEIHMKPEKNKKLETTVHSKQEGHTEIYSRYIQII